MFPQQGHCLWLYQRPEERKSGQPTWREWEPPIPLSGWEWFHSPVRSSQFGTLIPRQETECVPVWIETHLPR